MQHLKMNFYIAFGLATAIFTGSIKSMNSELTKQAMVKVGNPNVLVNLISRRVRQLTSGHSRPLLADTVGMGAADIALTEIIEGKMEWTLLEQPDLQPEPVRKKRKKA
jgi:DNA-directed RNA polymerase subunit omega